MLKVGLTGGYATGKSFVASEIERHGCHVIHADELGHRVLLPDGEAFQPTIHAFGRAILSDGFIDRKKLGQIVFSSPELLERLSSFVHPAVFRLEEQFLNELERQNPSSIGVVEAAILIETGRYAVYDRIILTVCEISTQIARGIKRDQLTREQVLARLEKQMPQEDKKRYAHYVVDTDGSKESTMQQVESIYNELKALAQGDTRAN